jgi:hypothetical protein
MSLTPRIDNLERNLIINGNLDYWQRGTSFTNLSGTAKYTADRFSAYCENAVHTLSRQSAGLDGSTYCMRMARNSGGTSTANFTVRTALENLACVGLAGKTVHLSFWARKGANFSPASGQFSASIIGGTGTNQNPYSLGSTHATAACTPTTTWQRFTLSVTLPSNLTQVGLDFTFTPSGTAGAADYLEIAQVMLTKYESEEFVYAGRNIFEELLHCQRYYHRPAFDDTGSTTFRYSVGQAYNSTNAIFAFPLPVAMRKVPTLELNALALINTGGSAIAITSGGLDAGMAGGGNFYNFLSA